MIGALWCRKGCNASELAGEFAYFPPTPSSFSIDKEEDGTLKCTLNPFYFQARYALSLTRTQAHVVELHSHKDVHIPAFSFRYPDARVTLLFSHSNAVDLGFLYRFFDELSNRLEVNVFAYEYSGYGPTASAAVPRNHTQRADVLAAYRYLLAQGIDPGRQVVAYGQSIGSYPTLYLASRHRLLGVVLHSPISSGMRVITHTDGCCAPHRVFSCLEPYPNAQLARRWAAAAGGERRAAAGSAHTALAQPLRRIRDPLFVIHGTADETVECTHGHAIYSQCPMAKRYEPYWVHGATHDDVLEMAPAEYYARLDGFITHCEAMQDGDGRVEEFPSLHEKEHRWDMRPVGKGRTAAAGVRAHASAARDATNGGPGASSTPALQPATEDVGASAGVRSPPPLATPQLGDRYPAPSTAQRAPEVAMHC